MAKRIDALEQFITLVASTPEADTVGNSQDSSDRIKALLARPSGGMKLEDFFRLKRAVLMSALDKSGTSDAVSVITAIWYATSTCRNLAPLSETSTWRSVIRSARISIAFWDGGAHQLNRFSREHAVIGAALRLKSRGYTYDLGQKGIALRAADFKRVCTKIDKLIEGLGGRIVIDNIHQALVRTGRMHDGSFLFGRPVTQVPQYRLPSIPWHFLYELGLKHLQTRQSSRDPAKHWESAVELARDVVALFDIEPYSAFENMDLLPVGIQDTLQDAALYDEVFAFQQWQPKYAPTLLDEWIAVMGRTGYELPHGSMEQWRALTASLIKATRLDRCATTTAYDHKIPGWSASQTEAVLAVLASGSLKVNIAYETPLQTTNRTSPSIPLFDLGKGFYLLPPRALLTRSLYERLYALLRDIDMPRLDNAMGATLEVLTLNAVAQTSPKAIFADKKYRDTFSRKNLQIDVLIETPDRIFFIECKKKALTAAARGGNTVNALLDLSGALLQMLVQLIRHERVLRTHGRIDFNDGTFVELKGREIERIAVTMLDHGSFQDRMFISSIVRGLFGATLVASSDVHEETMTKVNGVLIEIRDEMTELARITGEDLGDLLWDYLIGMWWLSVDMLGYLCREKNDLWVALRPMRHLTSRSGDIMTELSNRKPVPN